MPGPRARALCRRTARRRTRPVARAIRKSISSARNASNATRASTTDPDSQLFTKSNKAEALPSFMGHVLMGQPQQVGGRRATDQASGTAGREAALDMLAALRGEQRKTVGADKNYDTEAF